MDSTLVFNAAECRACKQVLVSSHRHDYRACACGNAVDGGKDYLKRSTVAGEDALIDLSIWLHDDGKLRRSA